MNGGLNVPEMNGGLNVPEGNDRLNVPTSGNKPSMPPDIRPVRVLVIGGGAAGLVAAISAARSGAAVTIAERMPRVGKKLLATGNGRCNLSNNSLNINNYHGAGAKPAFSIVSKYGGSFIIDFFKSIGVLTAVEDQSRLYPRTFSSATVLNALRAEAARLGVAEMLSHEAASIGIKGGAFETKFHGAPPFISDKVIVAAGAKRRLFLAQMAAGMDCWLHLGIR